MSEWMTSKRRFLSALFGGRVDRIPVGNPTSVATVELMEETGAFFPEAHLDPETMAALAAAGHEILGFDTIMPYFSVQVEAPALGCEMNWGGMEMMPDCTTHPYKEAEDIFIPAEEEFLRVPSIRAVVEAIKILREKYPNVAIIGKAMGPWTLAYHGFGVQDFLMDTLLNPEKVRKSLEKLQEISVMFANLQVRAGADAICFPDHATGDLVSPEMYRDFLLPLHKKIVTRIGAPLILHICGNTLNRAKYIAEEHFDCFHYDTKTDVVELKKILGKQASLIGGINNPEVLLFGAPDDVKKQARFAVKAGVEILAPECAIPLRTPNKNLKAIVEVAKETFLQCA
ncbi:MAG: MtaA/CmuA family methyltransferase [Deltaproteobacteria bacterium]|nr:MAG: MtaA/CmuA family methyltransferase [Deltaproteobacteria bacterium]